MGRSAQNAQLGTLPRARRDKNAPEGKSPTWTWLLPFALLMLAIVTVPLRILAEDGLPRFRALRAERAELEARNDRLRREVRSLQREVERLRSDPTAIERLARDELGMVREGELIFQFPE